MSEKNVLKEGEVYLSIALDVDYLLAKFERAIVNGDKHVWVAAFKNEVVNDNQPIYRSDSVAIWRKTKKSSKEDKVVKEEVI